jgi:hypothetical protein
MKKEKLIVHNLLSKSSFCIVAVTLGFKWLYCAATDDSALLHCGGHCLLLRLFAVN